MLFFCSHQEIALRGHNESERSLNKRNFVEVMYLVAAHDSIVMERLSDGPHNATYTLPEIQNHLLQIMASAVCQTITICVAAQSAGYFQHLLIRVKI